MALRVLYKFKNPDTLGMALWPFVLLKEGLSEKEWRRIYSHEAIHCQQQKELLVVFFYLMYGIEWGIRYLKHRDWYTAYRNISFEREAYKHERNYSYYKTRKLWAFVKFYKGK